MKNYRHLTYSVITAILIFGCSTDGNGNKNDDNTSVGTTDINFTTNSTKSITEGIEDVLDVRTNRTDITFSIVEGEDADKFSIDSQSGALSFKSAPDFENPTDTNKDNKYIVTIEARDGDDNSARVKLTIIVLDDPSDNGPIFTSTNSKTVKENELLGFIVKATNAVSYEIAGGEDQSRFTIDNTSGKLDFLNFIPDFEHSSDKNHDNIYKVDIKATDSSNYSTIQHFSVTIQDDPNEPQSSAQQRHIFKTGADDGIVAANPFGDDRNLVAKTVNGERKITLGDRVWEDSQHTKTKVTYNDALIYCNQLNYAGIDNWRVPKRHELFEIINYGKNPTIDDTFENVTGGDYWTSQPLINYKGETIDDRAFIISFTYGAPYPSKMDTANYVRCVSGSEYTQITPLVENEDEIYSDQSTGLEWTKAADNQTWADAKKRCEELNISNGDWRLPNISELHSIMPIYNEEFLLDKDGDGYGDLRGPFWSSTPAINQTKARYIANYWDGDTWAADDENLSAEHPVYGRDVLNDDEEAKTSADVTGSICVRGGHL